MPELRRLNLEDMAAAARVHRAAFDARLPWLAGLHTPDEDLAYFREQVFAACEVWGAFEGDALAGFIAFRNGWIDQLYVSPDQQGRGMGARLLGFAKAANVGLSLWTFQANAGARGFYEARGFEVVTLTDGAGNEEREPDALYRWRAG
ncbi:MAG: GNAT family N-acetyltransferase [Phenylobacterium sp.]|uniref:GNAT family N-acetyltransferase n=1 Tax=Phenylobacterium sp. TaxID=1871053 RepID=UPI00273410A8|nr:GNAT family N-acetyltransferase [Phenylobacterium sp.]MDP3175485.1 GNAT family N-acetyltransferase [Phenylobacterium sp.]